MENRKKNRFQVFLYFTYFSCEINNSYSNEHIYIVRTFTENKFDDIFTLRITVRDIQ